MINLHYQLLANTVPMFVNQRRCQITRRYTHTFTHTWTLTHTCARQLLRHTLTHPQKTVIIQWFTEWMPATTSADDWNVNSNKKMPTARRNRRVLGAGAGAGPQSSLRPLTTTDTWLIISVSLSLSLFLSLSLSLFRTFSGSINVMNWLPPTCHQVTPVLYSRHGLVFF